MMIYNRTRSCNDVLIGFRMSEEMAMRLNELCRETDLSRSQLLRRSVESYEPYKQLVLTK
jgi:predicted DNA-binding protein